MRPVFRGSQPQVGDRAASKPNLDENTYKFLARSLAGRLGEYCSYCEAPVRGFLQIEHMVAQMSGGNPAAQVWTNFLLACDACNTQKKDKVANEDGLARYFWPSVLSDSVIQSANDQPRWRFSFDQFLYRMTTRTLGTQTLVEVVPNTGGVDRTRAQETIDLFKLNRSDEPTDRRMLERSRTWTTAQGLASGLRALCGTLNRSPLHATMDAVRGEIRACALSRGFWSVWMTVFDKEFRPPAGDALTDSLTDSLLVDLFVQRFPGTAYLPATMRGDSANWKPWIDYRGSLGDPYRALRPR